MFSDNYGTGEGCVEVGDEHFSASSDEVIDESFEEGRWMDYICPVVRGVYAVPSPPIKYVAYSNSVTVSRNEQRICCIIRTFREAKMAGTLIR